MIDRKTFDECFTAITRALPRDSTDLEKNIRAALTGVFDRLDLVTREELEAQEAVLHRTRVRLKEMEEKIAALERRAAPP
jgi:BMFP domain-containing protein YqiC